ncbi:MAG: hypothetical protein FWH10_07515 [Oscillospiraceae bacterium]|nr:hypothetical protein [Oscillospiraceae bacterium]
MRNPQELREYILGLLKQRDISAHKMLVDCGYSKSLVNDLKKGQMPSADKIAGLAKYLGITTDCLLGNIDFEFDSEEEFISELRRILYGTSAHKLSEYDKAHILELAEFALKMKKRGEE